MMGEKEFFEKSDENDALNRDMSDEAPLCGDAENNYSSNTPEVYSPVSDNDFVDYTANNRTEGNDEARYDEIFDTTRPKRRWLSVVSMIVGIVGIVLFCYGGVALVLGVLSVVLAVLARKSLGYFDGFAIVGLILGIFAACFGSVFLLISLLSTTASFFEIFEIVNIADNNVAVGNHFLKILNF